MSFEQDSAGQDTKSPQILLKAFFVHSQLVNKFRSTDKRLTLNPPKKVSLNQVSGVSPSWESLLSLLNRCDPVVKYPCLFCDKPGFQKFNSHTRFSNFKLENDNFLVYFNKPDNLTTLPYLLLNEVASPLFCLHRVVNQLSAKAED